MSVLLLAIAAGYAVISLIFNGIIDQATRTDTPSVYLGLLWPLFVAIIIYELLEKLAILIYKGCYNLGAFLGNLLKRVL